MSESKVKPVVAALVCFAVAVVALHLGSATVARQTAVWQADGDALSWLQQWAVVLARGWARWWFVLVPVLAGLCLTPALIVVARRSRSQPL